MGLLLEIALGVFLGGLLLKHWEWVLGVVWILVLLVTSGLFALAGYLWVCGAY